jgi:hypothetical protein
MRLGSSVVAMLSFAAAQLALAQGPDLAARARVGCPSLEGRWRLELALDSSRAPTYPFGRAARGTLDLGGNASWHETDPAYPCRAYGVVNLDQTGLWGQSLHPTARQNLSQGETTRVLVSWIVRDSVLIDLAVWVEPGGLALRGAARGDSVTGTWRLVTGDVATSTFASGHFRMDRERGP